MRVILFFLMLGTILGTSGCAGVLTSGAVAGAGEVVRRSAGNIVAKTLPGSLDQTTRATRQALDRMGIQVTQIEKKTQKTIVHAVAPDLTIKVTLAFIGTHATRVTVDAAKGTFARDRATATELLTQIDRARLKVDPRATQYSQIVVQNTCRVPIALAVHYKTDATLGGRWETVGWFQINPGEKRRVAATPNRHVYLYAHALQGRPLIWRGNVKKKLGEKTYGFFEVNTGPKIKTYVHTLSCP